MAANQVAKRDVVVSKDALLKSYRKRLKVGLFREAENIFLSLPGRREEHGGQLQRDREALQGGGGEPGVQSHSGRGGRPGDAGQGLQHGQSRGEPHEAGLRSQDLSYPQRLPQCKRSHLLKLQYVQRNAGVLII